MWVDGGRGGPWGSGKLGGGPLVRRSETATSGHCSDAIVSYLFIYCRGGGKYRTGQPDGGLKDLAYLILPMPCWGFPIKGFVHVTLALSADRRWVCASVPADQSARHDPHLPPYRNLLRVPLFHV